MDRDENLRVTPSSGNVFADLGLEHPEELLAKAKLALAITRAAEERGGGPDAETLALLSRGRTRGFSIEDLMRMLNGLGQEVDVVVRPKAAA